MLVDWAVSGDWTVDGHSNKLRKGIAKVRPTLGRMLFKPIVQFENLNSHSPSVLPSGRVDALNASDADVLHLHWVQGEMLSIAEIGKLTKPMVWTLHDMWAFCGAEHYTEDLRWQHGYTTNNRPNHESGFDLNRWVWKRKLKHWKKPIQIVTPSNWLAECVRNSTLMRDWPVTVIPNPIDTERWKPIDQGLARELLGLPKDKHLLLFGAIAGSKDPRKGFDLLQEALGKLRGEILDTHLVIFGQASPKTPPDLGFPIHYTGHLHDDLSLQVLYSAADAFVLPSRQDNLPNTGVEALACGTPVVAFNTGGLPDIVDHQNNGYLATAFNTDDLACGIKWVLHSSHYKKLRQKSRDYCKEQFHNTIIAATYSLLYSSLR